jgi:DNA-binding transcriptional LysR family regulator
MDRRRQPRLSLDLLRGFRAAARHLSFTRAADELLDQMLPATLAGEGVAIGALPHFVQQLRDGRLCAPFGPAAVAYRGDFFIVVRRDVADDEAVVAFTAWLRSEAQRDAAVTPVTSSRPRPRAAPRARGGR